MGWLRDRLVGPSPGAMVAEVLKREVAPLEGTNMSLFHTVIPSFWQENGLSGVGTWMPGSAQLAERVWVANRCIKLNAQQIASMPLRYQGEGAPPDWLASPDPNWYPNGLVDAMHAVVAQLYGWGFSCQYVTDVDLDGFPRTWSVLPSANVSIRNVDGAREYKLGEQVLDARRVVQIDRDPSPGALHGTSALRSYSQNAWGLLAAGNQSMTVNSGGIPAAVLKPQKKITKEQAEALQLQWAQATTARSGLPPVLPPDLEFETLSFDPSELALLDTQEFNARAIATAFGVPAMLLNMPVAGGLTYQNPAALGEMWWRFELRPTANMIANAFTAQMLPAGELVAFDAKDTFAPLDDNGNDEQLGLLASRLGLAVQYGILTPEEARLKLAEAGLTLGSAPPRPQTSQVAEASPEQQPPRLQAIGGP